jgi:hypothetical protein
MVATEPDRRPPGRAHSLPVPWKVAARSLATVAVLAVLVHLLLPRLGTVEGSLRVLRGMRPWPAVLAVAAQACSYLGSGYLLRAAVALGGGRLSVPRGVGIAMAASSLGLVAGGGVMHGPASFRWIRAAPAPPRAAALGAAAPTLFNDGLLVGLSLIGLALLLAEHRLPPGTATAFAALASLLAAAGAAALWAARRPARVAELLAGAGARWARLRRRPFDADGTRRVLAALGDALRRLRGGGWRGPALGSAANLGFDMLTLWLLFAAAGHAVSPGTLASGYALPLLLGKAAFVVPGGIGVVEGGMAATYRALGVPPAETAVVVVAYRLLSFWLPSLAGLALVPYFQRGAGREAAAAREAA